MRQELKLKFGATVGEKNKHNLHRLEEASAALFHALVESEGNLSKAKQILEKNTGFEKPQYVNWALLLADQVAKIDETMFMEYYVNGDFRQFRSDLEEIAGVLIQDLTNQMT